MKNYLLFILLCISIDALHAIPGFKDKSVIKEIVENCSSTEVTEYQYLYVGEGLDKDCLISQYNKVFKQDSHKNWFAYTDWSSDDRKKIYPEIKTEIKDYQCPAWWSSCGSDQNIKSVTSIWSDQCGETCQPGTDFLYEVEDKFWFVVSDIKSDIKILKMDDNGHPLILQVRDYYSTLTKNMLIHIPKGKIFDMGSGGLSIVELSLQKISQANSGRKGYLVKKEIIDGKEEIIPQGAYWYDTESIFNFDTEESTWKYVNSSPEDDYVQCMKKQDFLELSGFGESPAFDHITEEVCYFR